MMLDTLKVLCLWYTAHSLAMQLPWETLVQYAIAVITFVLEMVCVVIFTIERACVLLYMLLPWEYILTSVVFVLGHAIVTLVNRWTEFALIALGTGLLLSMHCILCKLDNLEYRTRHIQPQRIQNAQVAN
jgi:hypothetical protein